MIRIRTRLNEGRPVEFHGVRITYSINTANLVKNDKNSVQLRSEIATFSQNLDWEMMVEDLLQSEFGSLVSRYSDNEILNMLGQTSEQDTNDELKEEYRVEKTHNIRKHGRLYNPLQSHSIQSNGGTILRNRRRSIQPKLRSDYKSIAEVKSKEPEHNTIDTISEQLSQSINALFSRPVLNINIEEIGKVSFGEIH